MKIITINQKYLSFCQNIKNIFEETQNSIHKARNEIKIVEQEPRNFVIKSFKIPHIINKIAYTFFRSSKAEKSYINSLKIMNFVPKPIAYIETKKNALLHESYFISEHFAYDFTIREPLTHKEFKHKNEIYQAFAQFTNELHNQGIKHLDYSPGNILIKKEDQIYIFKIIDINRMQFKTLNKQERLENFSKLWATDEDLSIIIKEYAKINHIDEKEALLIALKASQKHKDKKNFKKRLKGKKVVD
ncbi:MAG: FIG00388958: hypothetical protein [uncultured Sulfurovum sp.]|uniref:Protein kinase domain-containing protein n=1 Tax=uncultured Sulfurovum sp. TaxID=269237 RepID=A0A6S6T9B6_9BACT|nr:MAG: FIG00388958: hypothetical protein [uncultured Sulfurovum sp.]